jgi:hypothetical protein
MKQVVYIPIVLIVAIALNASGQLKTDTLYIRKDSLRGFSQSLFFETNRNSVFYDNITSFEFGMFDEESYENSLDYLKTNEIRLTKQKMILPSTNWITLKQYNGQFYAYHPCDFIAHYKVSINDSTYIDWTGEGPVANKIISQRKLNNTNYELMLTGLYSQDRVITIHVIDNARGIAVFEEKTSPDDKNYYLMIMKERIKSVPFIVNNCETYKQTELLFEEPDFEKLVHAK